jgi:putative Mg2+ transporter-C (MgtC) family protein
MNWEYFAHVFLMLGLAALCGGAIGIERELKARWAGLRTHIMVSLGAAVFVLAGIEAARNTPAELTRVIQGIATGVGFIGAGTIIKLTDRIEVRGLTTASSIWAAAAIGVAAGMGMYFLAICGTGFCLVVLQGLRKLELVLENRKGLGPPREGPESLASGDDRDSAD